MEDDLDLSFERRLDCREADLAVALDGVAVSDGQQCAGNVDRQIEGASGAEVPVIEIAAEHVGRATRDTSHACRRRDANHTPEGLDRDLDARGILDRLAIQVNPQDPRASRRGIGPAGVRGSARSSARQSGAARRPIECGLRSRRQAPHREWRSAR